MKGVAFDLQVFRLHSVQQWFGMKSLRSAQLKMQ